MEEIRADTWRELHELLYEGSWNERLGRFRSSLAFRGRGDAGEDLHTSLMRLGGDAGSVEAHLLRAFRRYAALGDVPVDSLWNWLALGQHHGLPTRLLDWTYSPYVALHFVTSALRHYDRDGAVWSVDFVEVHRLAPPELRRALEREGANLFTTEMLSAVARDLAAFENVGVKPFVVFVEPPSFDDRIVNQYALFSLASDPMLALDDWLTEHPGLLRKIVVPAELKWEVRDKLDQANITERVLFPGLDGLSRWVARYYTPRRRPTA
jgi:hypothetical protein